MIVGPWLLIDRWVTNNAMDGGSVLRTCDIHAVLCGSAQALSRAFVGGSGDARYADLTAELATASGYTAGGMLIPNKNFFSSGGYERMTCDPIEWAISAPIAGVKYAALVDWTGADKNIIAVCDLDTEAPGTNTITIDGVFGITPDAGGLMKWRQP